MTYRSKQAIDIYVKELDQLIKDKELSKCIFLGSELELKQLRHRALGYARVRNIVMTTTQKTFNYAKGLHLEYGGKIVSKKPTGKHSILY